ncbi:MAG: cysteine--tRNA ligase, partial [Emcibacteraceae bacterium]|nr:cysteine--tRNA ligase [Emcibacteraceae bacterium]
TNTKEEFKPIDPNHIKMYVCGPTVYNYAHVGNARPVVVFDTLYRLLKHDNPTPKKVTYARNITDIDDKIIEAAGKEFPDKKQITNKDIKVITKKFTKIYEDDMSALNALLPDEIPKATEYVGEMITLIADLIEKGHAYEADGHVLFQVSTMKDYGELSGRTVEDLLAGARVDVADYKREAPDFVLWKPSTDAQPGWDSPWGRGRPGWHTECSAMIKKELGTTIDIHGGGQDLIFPHHENEIAQSKCSHGGAALANHWMHNGYLTVDGEKMSKSLGNFVTVREMCVKHGRKAGESIRYQLLSAHYRQPVDFSVKEMRQARRRLDNWYDLTRDVVVTVEDIPTDFLVALRNDLDTPKAIAILHEYRNKIAHTNGNELDGYIRNLKAGANVLGLLFMDYNYWKKGVKPTTNPNVKEIEISEQDELTTEEITHFISKRAKAKRDKDFKTADEVREFLANLGIKLLDKPDGTTDWELD